MDLIHYEPGSSPLFLEMPHSGRVGLDSQDGVPDVLAERIRFSSEAVRATLGFGCDQAVPAMTGFEARRGDPKITTLSNRLSRVYTDPNRDKKTDVSGLVHSGFQLHAHPDGVIWAKTIARNLDFDGDYEEQARAQFEKMLKQPLSKEEFDALMASHYDRYHALIKGAHERILAEHGHVVHLSLHSAPASQITKVDGVYALGNLAERGPLDFRAGTAPDVLLIHNGFQSATAEAVEVVRHHFERAGLLVQDGEGPFLGNNGVTGIYGNPEEGVNVIGIEHFPHDIELNRHQGGTDLDESAAVLHRSTYASLFDQLSK